MLQRRRRGSCRGGTNNQTSRRRPGVGSPREAALQFATLRPSPLGLALAGATAVHAQSFSGAVTIGDSLSDSGNIAALFHDFFPSGNAFTTNPDPVYAEIVAAAFGYSQTNYSPLIAGSAGSDYAVGGA